MRFTQTMTLAIGLMIPGLSHAAPPPAGTSTSSLLDLTQTVRTRVAGGPLTCGRSDSPAGPMIAPSREEFIKTVCEGTRTQSIDSFISQVGSAEFEKELRQFSGGAFSSAEFTQDFSTFSSNNAKIPAQYATSKAPGPIEDTSQVPTCHFRPQGQTLLRQANFKGLAFWATEHLYMVPPTQVKSKISEMRAKLDQAKPDALILEGYQYAEPIPCAQMLTEVFRPESDIRVEADVLAKYAFTHQIKMIPGDSTTLKANVTRRLFPNDPQKAKQVEEQAQVLSFVYDYGDLIGTAPGVPKPPNPEELAMQRMRRQWGDETLSLEQLKALYLQINQRPLPQVSDELYADLTPASKLHSRSGGPPPVVRPLNRIEDQMTELRNQGLLMALEVTKDSGQYKNPVAIFGGAHLDEMGGSLVHTFGQPTSGDAVHCRTH